MTKYDASIREQSEKISSEEIIDVTIYKVDLEAQDAIAKRFNVRGVPALLYINKKGEQKALEYGIRNPKSIKENIIKYLK